MKLLNFKIKTKLVIVISTLLMFTTILMIISFISINNIKTANNNKLLIMGIEKYVSDIVYNEREYLDSLSDFYLSQYTLNINNLQVTFNELKKYYGETSDIDFILLLIDSHMKNFFQTSDSVKESMGKGYSREVLKKLTDEAKLNMAKQHQEFDETLKKFNAKATSSIDNYISTTERSIKITFILFIIIIAITTVLLLKGVGVFIIKPIHLLSAGMNDFGKGNMNIQVQSASKDEIGELSNSFNDMVCSIKEKLVMQKYISSSTVEMIKGNISEMDGACKETSFKKSLAIFFSDIRGFTSMSEALDPKEVVDILNLYLDFQANIIKEHNGDIDKFVGDEIVAIFDGDDMCDRAFAAAIEIQKRANDVNEERIEEGKIPVEFGIGINFGEVILGSIGSKDRMDFTIIGDNVNLAARLCGAAQRNEIIITKSVYGKLSDKSLCHALPPINVKGKSKPIEIFKI